MASKTIAWTTGSGNITLTYTGQGNGSISVASDENDLFEDREQSFGIVTTNGSPEKAVSILVKQKGKTYEVGHTFEFGYTGKVQEVTLPKGKYKLQCWGAQGGTSYGSSNGAGSKGGYSEGVLTLTEKKTLYVFVGGQGSRGSSTSLVNGGWNGGGASTGYSSYTSGNETGYSYPACGGGATDISTVTSSMSYSSGRTNRSSASLLARCIVAGGGAGGSYRYTSKTTTSTTWTHFYSDGGSSSLAPDGEYFINGKYYYVGSDVSVGDVLKVSNVSNSSYYILRWEYKDASSGSFGSINSTQVTISSNMAYVVVRAWYKSNPGSTTYDVYKQTTTSSQSNSSGYSNKSQQGGGTSGKGQYPGTQTSAGSGGGFGYGGTQNTTNYMYCSGGGGGGWYGGGTGRADGSTGYVNYSGGGSGFVNTAANASSRPSGYTGLQLDSGTTTAGNTSHPSTSGGTETGHSGNGYARITILDPNYVPDPLEDYTLLSYIQSSGSQYIDTGIVGKSGVSMEMDMSFVSIPSDATIIGSRTSSNRYYLAHYYQYWTYGYGNYYQTSRTASSNTRYTIKSTLKSGTQSMSINGSSIANATSSSTYNTGYNLYVCACNNAGSAAYHTSIRVYGLALYDNGELVRDYIPVKRNSDGVCGLWDKVNEVFYTSGSGTNFTGA